MIHIDINMLQILSSLCQAKRKQPDLPHDPIMQTTFIIDYLVAGYKNT